MSLVMISTPKERGFLMACGLLLASGHLMFGALTAEAALVMAAAWALLLAGCLLQAELPARRMALRLSFPVAGFTIVVLFSVMSLTDVIPGTGQAIWLDLGLPGAATLDKSETRLEIVKLLGLACVFLAGFGAGLTDARALRTLKLVAFASTAFIAIAIVLHVTGVGPKTQGGRLEATYLNPNTAGTVAGASLCLCVGLFTRAVSRKFTGTGRSALVVSGAGILICAIALGLTKSRGAVASTLVSLLVFLVCQAVSQRWTWATILKLSFGVSAGVLVLALCNQPLIARLSTTETDAMLRRFIFDNHWQAFTQSPWLGYGLGSFDTLNRVLLSPTTYSTLWNIRAVENVYLQWLVEGGLLLAIPMFATIAAVIGASAASIVKRRSMLAPLYAVLAVDVLFLAHGLFDFALQTYSVAMFWSFLLGLQLSWSAASSRKAARS